MHEFVAARLAPQLLDWAKLPAGIIAENVTGAAPLLVTFRSLTRLVVPIFCAPNFRRAGVTDNAPGVAVAVGVALAVGVADVVGVAVREAVADAEPVAVAVGVAVRAGVRAEVAVTVGVGVALGVAVGVAHAAGVADAELLTR